MCLCRNGTIHFNGQPANYTEKKEKKNSNVSPVIFHGMPASVLALLVSSISQMFLFSVAASDCTVLLVTSFHSLTAETFFFYSFIWALQDVALDRTLLNRNPISISETLSFPLSSLQTAIQAH